MSKPDRINFRLDPVARRRLQRACELTGLDEPTALRACIQAFVEHIEAEGGIWLPLAIVPQEKKKSGSFPKAGHLQNVDVAGPSIASTTRPAHPPQDPPASGFSLNEDSPASATPSGPRLKSTRPGVRKILRKDTKPNP